MLVQLGLMEEVSSGCYRHQPTVLLMTVSLPDGLGLDGADRALAGQLLTDFLDVHERRVASGPLVPALDRASLAHLAHDPFPEHGVGLRALFDQIGGVVLANSTAVASPRFLAYVLGPPTGIGPYAEAVAAALNQNCNFWQLSPAANAIEQGVVRWLGGLFGYPGDAGGLFTDGGSMATFVAVAAAIHQHRPEVADAGIRVGAPLVLYASEQAHRCVEKAAVLLGLGRKHVRYIPVDDRYQMRVEALRAAVRADRAAGREPFCVVASAGTVTTGSVDPIEAVAKVCRDEGLWLHIDGAYGALFVLSGRMRDLLEPCGLADSVALDPHKLLAAPLEAGCLLVRKRQALRAVFEVASPYLTDQSDPLLIDYMHLGPQLSRGFKAFKVWCALRLYGVAAFRAAADRMLELAEHLATRVAAEPALELLAPVRLSAVCLRLRRRDAADQRAVHRSVLDQLAVEGTALLGPIELDGRTGIRACVTNHRTTVADIDHLVDRLAALTSDSYGTS